MAWLSGMVKTRLALATAAAGFAMVLLTHTRTATIGLIVGVTAAMLSLVVVRRRARRCLVMLLVVAALAAGPFAGLVSTWFDRGQSSEELANLTGRAKVWDQIVNEHRSTLDLWLGTGLADKSFQGLPIDDSWLAVYQEQGLVGDLIVAAILVVLLVTCLIRPRGPASAPRAVPGVLLRHRVIYGNGPRGRLAVHPRSRGRGLAAHAASGNFRICDPRTRLMRARRKDLSG